jgi:hypothetical protein
MIASYVYIVLNLVDIPYTYLVLISSYVYIRVVLEFVPYVPYVRVLEFHCINSCDSSSISYRLSAPCPSPTTADSHILLSPLLTTCISILYSSTHLLPFHIHTSIRYICWRDIVHYNQRALTSPYFAPGIPIYVVHACSIYVMYCCIPLLNVHLA